MFRNILIFRTLFSVDYEPGLPTPAVLALKRSRDQFDRVVVFQRRAQQGVDQSG